MGTPGVLVRMPGIFKSVRVCVFQQLAHRVTHRIQQFWLLTRLRYAFSKLLTLSLLERKKGRKEERKKRRKEERKKVRNEGRNKVRRKDEERKKERREEKRREEKRREKKEERKETR